MIDFALEGTAGCDLVEDCAEQQAVLDQTQNWPHWRLLATIGAMHSQWCKLKMTQ